MKEKVYSAGDTIDSRCTKCRSVTNHTVVAMVGDKVARVECNTCRGTHNYRPAATAKAAPAAKTPAAPAPRKPRIDPVAKERAEWEELDPESRSERAVAYNFKQVYKLRDIIRHPTFGLGVVKKVSVPGKMDVLFQDGMKMLKCGM